jgi:hypothetical protein
MSEKRNFIIYGTWVVIVLILVFMQKGIETANMAHIFVILFLGCQWLLVKPLRTISGTLSARARFIGTGLCCAAMVEAFYMIHKPCFNAIKIVPSMSLSTMVNCYAIDLAFTLPVYLAVFSALWYFSNNYRYTLLQYALTFSLAQALGDGGVFFFAASPFLLLFIPYTLINYHAMNVLPWLLVREELHPEKAGWQKFVIPPAAIVLIYLAGGALIKIVGAFFKLT